MHWDPTDEQGRGLNQSPSQLVLGLLRLPSPWNDWIEARRVEHADSRDKRRQWMLEALSITMFAIMVPIVVVYFCSEGLTLRAGLWLLGPVTVASVWYLAIRGRARLAATFIYPMICAETTFGTYNGTATIDHAGTQLFTIALVIVLAALTESMRRTLAFGTLGVLAWLYAAVAQLHLSAQVTISISLTLVLLVVVGLTSAWINQMMFDRTEHELARNQALAAELEERVNERTRQLRELSERDELTGLLNRRHFMGQLEALTAAGKSASMLMIDVDHFKAVNDTYGHNTGDEVLRRVAGRLRGLVRGGDVLARLGGEEFAVLLPGVGVTTAAGVAERVRAEIAAMTWTDVRVPDSQVTVSLGISFRDLQTAQDVEELMQSADAGLYAAKRSGRNRVGVSPTVNDSEHTPAPEPSGTAGFDQFAIRRRSQSLAD